MSLKIHHLSISQSERIVWLAEELGLAYELQIHTRDPLLSPDTLQSVPGNATGKAPFLEDPDVGVRLSESGAIASYLLGRYGAGSSLQVTAAGEPRAYAEYLYWFHWANGTMQPAMVTSMFLHAAQVDPQAPIAQMDRRRLETSLRVVNERLAEHRWLAGDVFTAADIMALYCFTTQRYFGPQVALDGYDHVIRWMRDCSAREGYRRAMARCDPELQHLLGAAAPERSILETGGAKGDAWRKAKSG